MRIGRRSPSRLHALRFVLRCSRLAVVAFPAFFPSPVWASGRGARRSPLVGSSPAAVVAVSTAHPPSALTSQSRGTPVKRLFSGHAASRGAPHFYVSAYHYLVMLSLLPIPPLHLSITARGFGRAAIAQPLSALWSSAAPAFVSAHRASLPLASSRFAVRASLLALCRGCVSRLLPFVRLGQWARCGSFSVGGQQSRFSGLSINRSSPVCANQSVERDAGQAAFLRSCRPARRPSLLRCTCPATPGDAEMTD